MVPAVGSVSGLARKQEKIADVPATIADVPVSSRQQAGNFTALEQQKGGRPIA